MLVCSVSNALDDFFMASVVLPIIPPLLIPHKMSLQSEETLRNKFKLIRLDLVEGGGDLLSNLHSSTISNPEDACQSSIE